MKKIKFTQHPIRWINKEIIIPLGLAIFVIQFVIQAFKIPSQSMEDSLLVGDFLLGLKFVYGAPLPFTDAKLPSLTEPDTGDVIIFRYPGEPAYPDYDSERYSHIGNLLILGNYFWDHQPEGDQPSLISYFQGPKDFIKRVVAKSGQTLEVRNKKFYIDGQFAPIPGQGKNTTSSERMFLDNYGPVTLPKPGQTFKLDTLSLIELHRLKSLILQENPSSKVTLDLNLYVNGQLNNDFVWSPQAGLPFYMPESPEAMNAVFTKDIYTEEQRLQFLQQSSMRQGARSFKLDYKQPLTTGFIPDPLYMNQSTSFGMRQVAYNYFVDPIVESLEYNLASYQDLYEINEKRITADTTDKSSSDSLKTNPIPQFKLTQQIFIDGQPLTEYTIQEDVFFMAGDNRDNSSDSRIWGFLSRENVKAKAFIVYMSIDAEFTFGQNPQEKAAGYPNKVKPNEIRITNPFTWLKLPMLIRWRRIGKLIHGV